MEILSRDESAILEREELEKLDEWFVIISDPEPEVAKTLVMIGDSFVYLRDALAIHDATHLLATYRRHGKKPLSEAIHFFATIGRHTRKIVHVALEEFDRKNATFRSYRVYSVHDGYAIFYSSHLRIKQPLAGW